MAEPTVVIEVEKSCSAFQPLVQFLLSMFFIHRTRIPCKISNDGLQFQSNNESNSVLADVFFPRGSFSLFQVNAEVELALFSAPALYHAFLGSDKSALEKVSLKFCQDEDRLVWEIKHAKHDLPHEINVLLYDLQSTEEDFAFFDLSSRIDKDRFDVVAELESHDLSDALNLVKSCHDPESNRNIQLDLRSEAEMWFVAHNDYLNNAKIHVNYRASRFTQPVAFFLKHWTCRFLLRFSTILPNCRFYFRADDDSPSVLHLHHADGEAGPRFCVVISAGFREEEEEEAAATAPEEEQETKKSRKRRR